jgi:hypothetical protein
MVLYPSIFISSSGLISTYLFEKIFKKFFPKKYNKINKNLIKIIYLISALPGIIIFLRSGIWNFFNVFTRTNGYDLYNKNKLKINLKQNSIYIYPIDNSISLTDDEKNTLYIYSWNGYR